MLAAPAVAGSSLPDAGPHCFAPEAHREVARRLCAAVAAAEDGARARVVEVLDATPRRLTARLGDDAMPPVFGPPVSVSIMDAAHLPDNVLAQLARALLDATAAAR